MLKKTAFLHCLPRGDEVEEDVFLEKFSCLATSVEQSSCSKVFYCIVLEN